jgi:hypothetical protein
MKHFIHDLDYDAMTEEENLNKEAMRMRIKRFLEKARALVGH